MKTTRWMMAALLLASFALSVPGKTFAQTPDASVQDSSVDPGDEVDRWYGVLGAAICGGEMRLLATAPAIALHPVVGLIGAIGCAVAMIDIFTT